MGGGAGVKNLAFLFDEMGDVTQRQDNNLGLTENLYYDNDYRLTSSKLNGTQNLAVTYDNTMGNITARSDVAGGAAWTYSTTQKHAVTQAGSSAYQYAYDANGNATSRQGDSITWSSYNYPITVNAGSGSTAETVAFEYGPGRQRWQQSYTGNSTTETTNYIGGLLEMVISGSVTDYRHYIYGGTGAVAVYSRKTTGVNFFSYPLSDHQSSVASITSPTGEQIIAESFTAFGNRRNPTTWSGAATNSDLTTIAGYTREGYTFQTALGLWMGMNHMNGRVQDAVTGRMLSADPHIPDPTTTQDYNRYSYVNNNPLTYIDPSGFETCQDICKQDAGADIPEVVVTGDSPAPDPDDYAGPSLAVVTVSASPPGLDTVTVTCCKKAAPASSLPSAPPPPPPQGNQNTTCPHGMLSSIANQMILWGKSAQNAGSVITNVGGEIAVVGAIGTVTAGPEVGLPIIATGATWAAAGGITTYVGIGLQAAGALITTAYGNNQPGIDATLQTAVAGASALIDAAARFPITAVPGATAAADALAEHLAGNNPCPP